MYMPEYTIHKDYSFRRALVRFFIFMILLFSFSGMVNTCSAASEKSRKRSQYTIGIDPGHQSESVDMSALEANAPGSSVKKAKCTTGTAGRFTGVAEYRLNLDVSLKLRDILENMGYNTVMTRENNYTAISNKERALLMAEKGADICIRVHANGADDPSVSGALCMIGSSTNPYISYLYKDSKKLAEDVLECYCKKTGFSNMGIQTTDTMTGLNWASIPTIIIEMGFMTNRSDDTLMQKKYMQRRMARGMAMGIDQYFGIDDIPSSSLSHKKIFEDLSLESDAVDEAVMQLEKNIADNTAADSEERAVNTAVEQLESALSKDPSEQTQKSDVNTSARQLESALSKASSEQTQKSDVNTSARQLESALSKASSEQTQNSAANTAVAKNLDLSDFFFQK